MHLRFTETIIVGLRGGPWESDGTCITSIFSHGRIWFVNSKFEGSIGLTGNQNFDTNEAVATYQYYTDANYLGMTGILFRALGKPLVEVGAEKDYNVGVDATLHRATLRFDLYRADTENMLTDVSVPTSTGFATVKDNLGLVRNSGIEAYLSYGVLQQNRTFLTVFSSLVTTKNKSIRLSESMRAFNELRRIRWLR